MRTPRPVPEHLRDRTFSLQEARAAGISGRMLEHDRFREVYPRVYCLAELDISSTERIAAARRNLPDDARTTHVTRLRELGYEHGELEPLHFVVPRDLHLVVEGITLHRTVRMPPNDGAGVCAEAVFVSLATTERLIDLIVIGDWMLRTGHMSLESLGEFVRTSAWRPGAAEVLVVMPNLDARSCSPKESGTRSILAFAGLPTPEVNAEIHDSAGVLVGIGDLVYRRWKLLIEYEGRQHALDVSQFARDIDRYGGFRSIGWDYFQVTNERLARPRAMVLRVHGLLLRRGYDGPAPAFGARWSSLFAPLTPRRGAYATV
ncbi:hypothetical protein [Aeromicrobium chenweiae]|uniref:Uncharacterized protein n=1 Tax=Aeromicrobium chenweiae TaxID=2079793 RepID=A0A2S0WJ81_9ACTN|nr:hypothetical protein [Aeromicrobium chenweiae]AWB91396.1 hypothetical protein C3E78_03710 [Aeromicrobium chenweiae]TGN30673.1 hypothetical protein E4L97_16425 [Aeromicrobium chenweiae]